jgi:tRNA-splicing ligase RtcB (3'-phosphate/5'-hydroxy nucleic acid ligase)
MKRKEKTQIEVTKINDNEWEIPKQGKMNVPVRIFASEKLLNLIKKDRSLEQGMNVACLPNIQKFSFMMPDAHQGYGMSVGGVAAFPVKDGIISPGMTGFDINCLTGDSKVLTPQGYNIKIKEIEKNYLAQQVSVMDIEKKDLVKSCPMAFLKKEDYVLEVKTRAGDIIKATADHPFLTRRGMIPLKDLKESDSIAMYPFTGVEYEASDEIHITGEKEIEKAIEELGVEVNKEAIIAELKKRNLFPLTGTSHKLPTLLKLLGFITGDGSASSSKKNVSINFYGKPEDLETIRQDIQDLGYSPYNIYSRDRDHTIQTQYREVRFQNTETSFSIRTKSFAILMKALGLPFRNKTKTYFRVPKYMFMLPKWMKRLYLASYFGAEMSKPKAQTTYNLYCPAVSINKVEKLKFNGIEFMEDIQRLVEYFGIKTTPLSYDKQYLNKDGNWTYRVRLLIKEDTKNLIEFYATINYEYCKEKRILANIACQYLKRKQQIVLRRQEIRKQAVLLNQEGFGPTAIAAQFPEVNKRFIERSIYGKTQTSPRTAYKFIGFNEYKHCVYNEAGIIFESIKKINNTQTKQTVYDFTVANTNHNFLANGFIVSNCGVRVLATQLKKEDVEPKIKDLLDELFKNVPSGVGKKGHIRLNKEEINKVLTNGSKWAVENSYAFEDDLEVTESFGCLEQADTTYVSSRAKDRGRNQLGTLGAGNHFLEVQYVDQIYKPEAAKAMGITEPGQICVMIHCGSRGLGHQICTDYLRKYEDAFPEIANALPDRDLIYAPADTPLAKEYFGAMSAAANFAWCNRQVIAHGVRKAFKTVYGTRPKEITQVYDVAHNMIKKETYTVDGEEKELYIHRKGATRAFGPHNPEIPQKYQEYGQPVLIPGSMGTASFILVGAASSAQKSFASTAHGAGRVMSRNAANKLFKGDQVKEDLELQNIHIKAASWRGISEEAPGVYKDIDEVIKVSNEAGIGNAVVRLRPLGVVKG